MQTGAVMNIAKLYVRNVQFGIFAIFEWILKLTERKTVVLITGVLSLMILKGSVNPVTLSDFSHHF